MLHELLFEYKGEELTYDEWIKVMMEIEANPPDQDTATKDEIIEWLVARKAMQMHRESFS